MTECKGCEIFPLAALKFKSLSRFVFGMRRKKNFAPSLRCHACKADDASGFQTLISSAWQSG